MGLEKSSCDVFFHEWNECKNAQVATRFGQTESFFQVGGEAKLSIAQMSTRASVRRASVHAQMSNAQLSGRRCYSFIVQFQSVDNGDGVPIWFAIVLGN